LAKALKYQMAFKTVDNKDVTVDFRVEGATGSVVQLQAGVRPVVFREYNTDEDIFKPIRAFLCELQIVTNVNGVALDTFIANNDTDIEVIVHYNGYYGLSTWYGYILQDDIEEVWDDGNHYLIVRAAEGFGLLKTIPFAVAGAEPVGKYTPIQLIENALSTLFPSGVTADYFVLNNLFHDSMVDTAGRHPLNQCYIDAKTFQIEGTLYDDCYTVIEKICAAFGQSIFFDGQMWLFRTEELYTSYNNNLRVANVTSSSQFEILTRYDIEIGVGREMQPIMPEMLRSLNRATKFDEVDFYYNAFDEVLINETFERGTQTASGTTYLEFSINSWTYGYVNPSNTTTPPSGVVRAREDYAGNLSGALIERYVFFPIQSLGVGDIFHFIRSHTINVYIGTRCFIKVDFRFQSYIALTRVAFVTLQGTSTNYYLNENGDWLIYTTIPAGITVDTSTSSGITAVEWNSIEVNSLPFPVDGVLTVYLSSQTSAGINTAYFKNFSFKVISSFESETDLRRIKGENSLYTKSETINNSYKKEIFLDDHFSSVFKGAIFQSDQTTLTDEDWYRYRFVGESFGFRRQNATARWEHNRFNRNKIDVNMYGISWDTGSGFELMSFKNTYRFMDDDVNKIYYPANISEIDLVNNTWSGTLVEVWDETKDLPIAQSFAAFPTNGTYTTTPLTLPLTLTTSGGFTIVSGNTARYDGLPTINSPITAIVSGQVSASSYPKIVTFELRKNGTAIKTINQTIYTANQFFYADLSVGTQTLATNDTIAMVATGHNSITILSGQLVINTQGTTYTYNTYTDNYLYQ
jgi:hypothetical protein